MNDTGKEQEKAQRQTSELPLGQSNKIACAPMSSVVCSNACFSVKTPKNTSNKETGDCH